MNKKILIGKVSAVFGIKGEVKIISFCENPTQIENYQLFDSKGNSLKIKIANKNKAVVGTSSEGAILIAKIEGINDRTSAEKLRGTEIFTNRDEFEETSKNEFYYVDLIGLDVIDETSQKIGKVTNILDFGGGAALEIEFEKSGLEKNQNFPFKNEIFPEVNLEAGFVKIIFPEMIEIKR